MSHAGSCSLAFASRAPSQNIERLKERMGWGIPWDEITDDSDSDFDVGEWHGTLDITAVGRQEEWEDSPEGYPRTPQYEWWPHRDDYGE